MKKLLFGFFLVLSLVPFFVFAQMPTIPGVDIGGGGGGGGGSDGGSYLPIVQCGPGTSKENCTLCDFLKMIERTVKLTLFGLVPPIAAVVIALAGIFMIVSHFEGGNTGLLEKARKTLVSVLIGLLLVYAAWVIINTFFQIIGVASWTGLEQGWWSINCND